MMIVESNLATALHTFTYSFDSLAFEVLLFVALLSFDDRTLKWPVLSAISRVEIRA